MGARIRSALLAGFIAGFAWMFFSNLFKSDPVRTALIGLGFVVVVAIITAVIAASISRSRGART